MFSHNQVFNLSNTLVSTQNAKFNFIMCFVSLLANLITLKYMCGERKSVTITVQKRTKRRITPHEVLHFKAGDSLS